MYKLIICDYSMPEMDGPSLALALRSLLQESAIPQNEKKPYLCCVTAYASPGFENQALEAGMDRFLTKPLSDQTIRDILQRLNTA